MLVFRHDVRPRLLHLPSSPPSRAMIMSPRRYLLLSALLSLFLLSNEALGQAAGGGGGCGGGCGGGGGGYYHSSSSGGEGGGCTPATAIILISVFAGLFGMCVLIICISARCTDEQREPVDVGYLKMLAHAWVRRCLPAEAGADYKLVYEYDFCVRVLGRAPVLGGATSLSYPSGVWRGHYEQNGRKHTVPDFGLEFSEFSSVVCVSEDAASEVRGPRPESLLSNGSGGDNIGSYDIVGLYCSAIVERSTAPLASPRVAFVKTYRRGSGWREGNLAHSILYQGEVVAGWMQVRKFWRKR